MQPMHTEMNYFATVPSNLFYSFSIFFRFINMSILWQLISFEIYLFKLLFNSFCLFFFSLFMLGLTFAGRILMIDSEIRFHVPQRKTNPSFVKSPFLLFSSYGCCYFAVPPLIALQCLRSALTLLWIPRSVFTQMTR